MQTFTLIKRTNLNIAQPYNLYLFQTSNQTALSVFFTNFSSHPDILYLKIKPYILNAKQKLQKGGKERVEIILNFHQLNIVNTSIKNMSNVFKNWLV